VLFAVSFAGKGQGKKEALGVPQKDAASITSAAG